MNIPRSRLAMVLAIALGAVLALAMWTRARAHDSDLRPPAGRGPDAMRGGVAYGGMMGGGMMGGGMMGGGMMGGYGPSSAEPPESSAPNKHWDELSAYVQSNRLACMSCHTFSARSAGPAFLDIAHRFSGQANGEAELAGAIRNGVSGQWPGYPPMPGGLATAGQAKHLASLILDLQR